MHPMWESNLVRVRRGDESACHTPKGSIDSPHEVIGAVRDNGQGRRPDWMEAFCFIPSVLASSSRGVGVRVVAPVK